MPPAPQTAWRWTKSNGMLGLDKLVTLTDKLGVLVNKSPERLDPEAFWPAPLHLESEKAAKILRSFCKDGFYEDQSPTAPASPSPISPRQKQGPPQTIPSEIIKNAKGVIIFTAIRSGLWISGSGGSGIVVARNENGTWSSPSGIMLHTPSLQFLDGVDIYDCICIINTRAALNAFREERCTLGEDVWAVPGPLRLEELLEADQYYSAPIFTYLKSRSVSVRVPINDMVFIQRADENERYYERRISVTSLFAASVNTSVKEFRELQETLRCAQGDSGINTALLPVGAPPSHFEIEERNHVFGVPDKEDPDPFGVLALEKQGLEIREAGTSKRPTSDQFDFKPSPTSPIYSTFSRSIHDKRKSYDFKSIRSQMSPRQSWRISGSSHLSQMERPSAAMVDMSTQTDFEELPRVQEISEPTPFLPASENKVDLDQKSTASFISVHSIVSESPSTMNRSTPTLSITDAEPTKSSQANLDNDDASIYSVTSAVSHQNGVVANKVDIRLSQHSDQISSARSSFSVESSEQEEGNGNESLTQLDSSEDEDADDEEEDEEDDDDDIEEGTVVFGAVQQAAAPQAITRARLVTVAKAAAPKLPARNPIREQSRPLSGDNQPLSPIIQTNDNRIPTSPVRSFPSSRHSLTNGSRSSICSHSSVASSIEAPDNNKLIGPPPAIPEYSPRRRSHDVQRLHVSKKDQLDKFYSLPSTPILAETPDIDDLRTPRQT